jgi:hypothetical protein
MIGGPFGAFPHGDQREQAPQAVPVDDFQVSFTVSVEEALQIRLGDVLGIIQVPQPGAKPEGESDELEGEAAKEFLGRCVVPAV